MSNVYVLNAARGRKKPDEAVGEKQPPLVAATKLVVAATEFARSAHNELGNALFNLEIASNITRTLIDDVEDEAVRTLLLNQSSLIDRQIAEARTRALDLFRKSALRLFEMQQARSINGQIDCLSTELVFSWPSVEKNQKEDHVSSKI